MICSQCNNTIPDDAASCEFCGKTVTKEYPSGEEAAPPSAVPALPPGNASGADGLYEAGMDYYFARGVEKDAAKAAVYWTQAAELGHPIAQNNLAWMYDNGDGVPVDVDKSFYWYTQSARQGFAKAQYNLGLAFKNGAGTPVDLAQSKYWLDLAAAQEPEPAEKPPQTSGNGISSAKRAFERAAKYAGTDVGKVLLKWGLLIIGAHVLMFILSETLGIYAGFIGLAIELAVIYIAFKKIYMLSSLIECHIYEFYLAKDLKFDRSSVFFTIMPGILWMTFFWGFSVQAALIGIVFIAVPLFFMFVRRRRMFWKLLLLDAIMFPIILTRAILGLVYAHEKSKTTRSVNKGAFDTATGTYDTTVRYKKYTYEFPEDIYQDGKHLTLFIGKMAGGYYVDDDDTVYHVAHERTYSFGNVKYDITPLYNRYDPTPKWIAWLY